MSRYQPITKDEHWHRFEARQFKVTAINDDTGSALDCSGKELLWRVSKEAGSDTVYLAKTSGFTISGVEHNEILWSLDPATDYQSLDHGEHWHELISKSDNAVLAFGEAVLWPMKALT